MSERSKGDTSSSVTASSRIVKNPLLSASVTGLTFDDFQNKPLLLPAAPPIIHPVPVVSSRESTPLVTVGKSSDIDSENLSEINLNDFPGTTASSSADISDENSNTLIEPSTQAENSILSQAASSFSQLPSVASSVFSTFSKKFNPSSTREDINLNPSPQLDIQPFTTQFVGQAPPSALPPPTAFVNQEQQQQRETPRNEHQLPVDPPTFYTPSEVPAVRSGVPSPPTASSQNTYRISARKKIYAPIPGLTSAYQDPKFPAATAGFLPPVGFDDSPIPVYPEHSVSKPEERKGGLFSLSVPNVFQNLSGLVQSAAGSLTQKSPEPVQQQPIDSFGAFQIETHQQGPSEVNFFEKNQIHQQAQVYQPPPPANFCVPEQVVETAQSILPLSGHLFAKLPAETFAQERVQSISPQSEAKIIPSVPPSSELITAQPPQQPPFAGILFGGLPPKSNTPEVQPAFEAFALQHSPVLPPPIKPPSGGPPSTSFRLQKGTRLYKSPFAAARPEYQQEPISGYPPAPQSIIPLSQTNTDIFGHFNPLQHGSIPSQGSILPVSRETKPDIKPVPPIASETIPNTAVQEVPTAFSIASVNNPIPVNLNENSLSNLVTNPSQTIPLNIASEQPEENLKPSSVHQPPEVLPRPESTINPVNVSETKPRDTQEALNSTPISLQEQLNLGQSILLPPPPAVISGITTDSKETANFPPPPPQHSFQNKQNSNPYRKGLQSHHTQLPAPAALSTILTPQDQNINLFKPIGTEVASPIPEGPPTITTFFPKSPVVETLENQAKLFSPAVVSDSYEVSLVSQELSTLILSGSVDRTIGELSSVAHLLKKPEESPPQVETHPTFLKSNIFTPIAADSNFPLNRPLLNESAGTAEAESTSLPKQPIPVSSFFATTSEPTTHVDKPVIPLKESSEERRATPTSASNIVNFFKANSPLNDHFSTARTKDVLVKTEAEDRPDSKPDKPAASVPAASAKIASPLKSENCSESQQPVPNLFTSFFEQAAPTIVTPVVNQPSLPDPTSFFDSLGQVPSVGVDAAPPEDPNSQRIQNFFNNPPPKDLDPVGDLNYNLVGSGLAVKNLQTRSLTPASNLAEPPSSSCSEFSELNSSLSAANRQPRVPAEDSNKVSPEEEAIFEAPDSQDLPEDIINEIKEMANSAVQPSSPTNMVYKPAVKHWFYKRTLDTKHVWVPFSYYDSALLEEAFLLRDERSNFVAVEGGRYDVNISERIKAPVYWEGEPIEVKRCSWFYKASDSKYVPYEEEIADLLEEEYRKASETCEWHKKIPISAGDMVVFHGPTVIVHFQPQQQVDSWGGSTLDSENFLSYIQQQTTNRPRVVKRDLDDFTIDEGESHKVDHLLFMVHGIGSACDLKMRSVEEVVDEFRAIALQLVQSHYKNSVENGYVGRVEVLPVSWHSELHSDELGIDEKLKSITLESIPKLRNFTNDTLLDILFYTSPMFCQRIMNTVTASMNSIIVKYKQRHPEFHGGISMAGHSLGSLILFDLLCHQRPLKECEEQNLENPDEINPGYPVDSNQLNEDAAKHISYKMGPAGTGQPFISYPQLIFQPKKFFALGSPIGMFVTIRGIDKLGLDFRLPTCPGFYNIFHPYDPVAYRLEALVNPDMNGIPPVLIPHHKGRKRMHLELKETMSRVGADLKQRFFDTFKTTFDSVSFLAPKTKVDVKEMEKEVDKILETQKHQDHHAQPGPSTLRSRADSNSTSQSDTDIIEIDFPLGKLNDSKRVDYVLQEAPLEFFNEYLFALSSHVCYWESEDTILFVMKEIYNGIGYSPDSQVPQQTMTIERPSSSGSMTHSPTS